MGARSYYVAFDTNEMPGKVVAVKVTLDTEIQSLDPNNPEDLERGYPINMKDDPLYDMLEAYVVNNPRNPGRFRKP